jgi:hypothetical protein
MLRRRLHLLIGFALVLSFAVEADAQEMVVPDQVRRVNRLFNEQNTASKLRCKVQPWGPSLGFDLTYRAGFFVELDSAQLAVNTDLNAFLRVTPAGRSPALLSTVFKVPRAPRGEKGQRFDFVFSGDFGVGEGNYYTELLLIDAAGRRRLTRWKLKTGTRGDGALIGPLKVVATPPIQWNGELDPMGTRLTVLIDATESSTSAARLGPSTAVYLLSVLSAILRNVPCRSVAVVAFNLDQQREIFRADYFSPSNFIDLARSLRDFQSVAIPIDSLRPSAWREFLGKLTTHEVAASEPPDALIFVGVPSHFVDTPTVPKFNVPTRIFDFEYLKTTPIFIPGSNLYEGDYRNVPDEAANFAPKALRLFPDAIDRLTRQLHGTVFQITSPSELRPAIEKMREQLQLPH